MPLGPTVLADLALASRNDVEASFGKLPSHWAQRRLLSASNRYQKNIVDKIKADLPTTHIPQGKIVQSQLNDYIAASTFVHAMDGWALLGRAIDGHLHGDPDVARHLAYYAELRAAMSLLAAEGLGIFDKKHFVVNGRRSVKPVSGKNATHVFAWEALDDLISKPSGTRRVLETIAPAGRSASEWLDAFAITPGSAGLIAQDWVKGWGLDLQRMMGDREARNLSSYRPSAFHDSGVKALADSLNCVTNFWRLAEPTTSDAFGRLDAYLLRDALEKLFKHQVGRSSLQARKRFAHQIRAMLHAIGPTITAGIDWPTFFLESNTAKPQLLVEASGRLEPTDRGHDLQVIGRATLLLRLATGASRKLLQSIPVTERQSLSFWWHPIAERRGIWATNAAPRDAADLWADVEPAVLSIEAWTGDPQATGHSVADYTGRFSSEGRILSGFERLALWGLGF